MNVLQLINNFENPLYISFIKSIDREGFDSEVFFSCRKNLQPIETNKYSGLKYHQRFILSIWTSIFYLYKLVIQYRNVRRDINFANVKLIHAHTLFSDGGVAFLLKMLLGIPYIIAVRNTDFRSYLRYKPWLFFLAQWILKDAERIICISPQLEKQLFRRFGNKFNGKVSVIPNGLEESFFTGNYFNKNVPQNVIKLLFIGRFSRDKNIHRIIDFISDRKEFVLTIVGGGGDANDEVLKQINEAERVIYLGFENSKDKLISIYRANDIFIMPSINETFGLVYVEAMSQGLPIVYTRGTGIDGYFKEGLVGAAVNPYNFYEWDIGFNYILKNYLEISENVQNEAKKFRWKNIASRYKDIYESTLR